MRHCFRNEEVWESKHLARHARCFLWISGCAHGTREGNPPREKEISRFVSINGIRCKV